MSEERNEKVSSNTRKRPSGSLAIRMGFVLSLFGAIGFMAGISHQTPGSAGPNYGFILLLGSGVSFIMYGMLLRAIWFLPGPDEKEGG